jgi:hypothetical protein
MQLSVSSTTISKVSTKASEREGKILIWAKSLCIYDRLPLRASTAGRLRGILAQTFSAASRTESLAQLIVNVRSIFRNEIDKMMTPYKKSNPDFYNGYFAARAIVNRVASHAAPKKPTPPPPNP